ncbi:fatty acid desaturase [Pendulispora albinea]|uniref:Fatty acid desaturase n=1 Tax=Pendulispora albinea TaxID=2741071 RepID=A0ABZ2LYS0_9BACT
MLQLVVGNEQKPETPLEELLRRSRELEGVRLADIIPRSCFTINSARGLVGFFASYALWAAGLALIAYSPHWLLWLPASLVAGLGGWGLHCIAHDCGHGSFSSSRRFNYAIGHIALLPMLYPFHGWRHVHNLHHANTNNLEKDTDWRPVGRAMYERMPLKDKSIYFGTRSIFFWLGTAHYELISGFRTNMFPGRKEREEVRRSILFVVLVALVAFPLVVHFTGWLGLVKFVLLPWLGMHAWFSATTLMHHTSEDVPFLGGKQWTRNASKLLLTTDYKYSALLHFFTHNISIHTAHHVAPKVPFYNLPQANAALRAALPGMMREKPFSWRELYTAVRRCHLYNPQTGFYSPFGEDGGSPPLADKALDRGAS